MYVIIIGVLRRVQVPRSDVSHFQYSDTVTGAGPSEVHRMIVCVTLCLFWGAVAVGIMFKTLYLICSITETSSFFKVQVHSKIMGFDELVVGVQ